MSKKTIRSGDPALGYLNEEVQQILHDPARAPNFGSDIATLRRQLREAKARQKPSQNLYESLVHVENVSMRARDGHARRLRIYIPKSSCTDKTLPAIVWFHGGGFCLGDLDTSDAVCHRLGAELPAVVVNVDYRLAPEHPFPTPVNDGWDAVQWVSQNSSGLGADLHRGFIVGGIFTGANIAAVVSHLARDQQLTPPLTGVFLEMPALLDPDSIPKKYATKLLSYQQNTDDPVVRPDLLRLFWDSYLPEKSVQQSHLASPLLWPGGHHGLPPTCLQVCGADPLRDEALLYEKELRERCGLETRLYFYKGMPHGFATYFRQTKLASTYHQEFLDGFKWFLGDSTK